MSEIEKPPLVSQTDRRRPRKRVLFGGKIIYGDGAFTLDCTIRDISESGAKVGISAGIQIPNDVYFIDLKASAAFGAQVVWRHPPNIGLKFVQPIDLENPPKALIYLQRLWRASTAR